MDPILANNNSHPRDASIKFYARGHKYEILTDPGTKYQSVTNWNHQLFPKFDADAVIAKIFKSKNWGPNNKYWGMSAEQIKASWKSNGDAVSSSGTNLHERIEHFMNNNELTNHYTHSDLLEHYLIKVQETSDQIEWSYFLQFVKDHSGFKPYRTEWMIYDEDLKLAGSIDMVYENDDGTLSIYDWKRSKEISKINMYNQFAINPNISHLPDTNFWHYALQLNTYKSILESKYGKNVTKLCLVRLHPDAEEKNYELIDIPILTKEINDLFLERKKLLSA